MRYIICKHNGISVMLQYPSNTYPFNMKTLAASLVLALVSIVLPTSASAQITRDIAYGSLDRQKYDLYLPPKVDNDTPVLFFIYGGSWESGRKSSYSFVGKTFSKEGFITVVPDYRLFPQVSFPAFVNDAALAFAKVRQKYPNRKIFVSGHSAGAQIGALLTLDGKYLARQNLLACRDIAGFIGLAGPYDFEVTEEKFKQIFPENIRPQSQAVNFASGKAAPSLLLHGKTDVTVHAEDSKILGRKLNAAGNLSEVKLYNGVGHINIVAALSPLLGIVSPTKRDMVSFMKKKAKLAPAC